MAQHEQNEPTPQEATRENAAGAEEEQVEAPRAEGVTAGDAEAVKVTTAIPADDATLVPGPTGQQSAHEGGTTDSGGVQQQG